MGDGLLRGQLDPWQMGLLDPGNTGVPMGPDGPQTSPRANFEPRGTGQGLFSKAARGLIGAPFQTFGAGNPVDVDGSAGATSWGDAAHNTAATAANFIPETYHAADRLNQYASGGSRETRNAELPPYNPQGDAFSVALAMPMGGLLAGGRGAGVTPHPGVRAVALAANREEASVPGLALAGQNRDALGYRSGALDAALALPQAKGTPEQMLAMLRKGGAKQSEIDATGLGSFLEGRPTVTRDEIAQHLQNNKVGLTEKIYGAPSDALLESEAQRVWEKPYRELDEDRQANIRSALRATSSSNQTAKWSRNSLDPSNPSYRETVLHLPVKRADTFEQFRDAYLKRFPNSSDGYMRAAYNQGERPPPAVGYGTAPRDVFQSGHFPEPNITGHMLTSMTKHEGKPVFTLDQIQSDWGQRLRDGGVRDEAKIADLDQRIKGAAEARSDARKRYASSNFNDSNARQEFNAMDKTIQLLSAERDTAKASATGHPLVNTTDQWTNTTLRRAIQHATEANADHIAIPHGDTVLSYNPGDAHGMNEFYNKIVPKNFKGILSKIDPSVTPSYVPQLQISNGQMAGKGFTMFPLTDAVKKHAREHGFPLFSNPKEASVLSAMTPVAKNASVSVGYDAPSVKQRPFNDDYPGSTKSPLGSPLERDIDGRDLRGSATVAGRRNAGHDDVPLTTSDRAGLERALDIRAGTAPASRVLDNNGTPVAGVAVRAQRADGSTLKQTRISDGLTDAEKNTTWWHEFGHHVDADAGNFSFASPASKAQAEELYHALATDGAGNRNGLMTPDRHGYTGTDYNHELIAEGLRTYATNPNYIKKYFPEFASNLRAHINDSPISHLIQLNANPKEAALLSAMPDDDTRKRRGGLLSQ